MSSYIVHDMANYVFELAHDEQCFRPIINAAAPTIAASLPFFALLVLGLHLLVHVPPAGYAVLGTWALLLAVILLLLQRASVACWKAIVWSPVWQDARENLLRESRSGELEQ
eukprot:4165300-Amphidinium_carterae.1